MLLFAFGSGLAFAACTLPNPDHCLHRSADANAWCAEHEPTRPFCSPCVAENHGCVTESPTPAECPEYTAEPVESESGSESTDADTTDTNEACDEIETEYEALVTMTDCETDDQCKIVAGHCGDGLGGCDYAVNVGVDSALDDLAQAYVDANCPDAVCDCGPPPASAMCMNGSCVGVN
jgi:hypothetical protein